jgi:hypothetical protein
VSGETATLFRLIHARIVELSGTARVFQDRAPDTDPRTRLPPVFPYVVWRVTGLTEDEDRDLGGLEVDVWDDKPTTDDLERLADQLDGDGAKTSPSGLHRHRWYIHGDVGAILYRISRLSVPDPDPGLRRRQLRYRIQTYLVRG